MKTVDLRKGHRSLDELLTLAKAGALRIHSESGEEFVLERADDFDREAAVLGRSEKFTRFLRSRSSERDEIPIGKVSEKRVGWRRRK